MLLEREAQKKGSRIISLPITQSWDEIKLKNRTSKQQWSRSNNWLKNGFSESIQDVNDPIWMSFQSIFSFGDRSRDPNGSW